MVIERENGEISLQIEKSCKSAITSYLWIVFLVLVESKS